MIELPGFEASEFIHDDICHTLYCKGKGPGVVLMHELPGMTKECIELAERLARKDFRVYMPLLFGRPGDDAWRKFITKVCISHEFRVFAARRTSPIVDWLRALCRKAHEECGGPGVGAIGMCLTGNFAISLMADENMLAPVASQPSLPFHRKRALALDPDELERVKQRARQGQKLIGLRFKGDKTCPPARFERLEEELGDAFVPIDIDPGEGNPHNIRRKAHSVLTGDFCDKEGHPTLDALNQVLAFLDQRLRGASMP